jgi:hypothetical protein
MASGPIKNPKVTRMVMRQHGHGRILITDAANCELQNPTSCKGVFFLKVAIDRAPGGLSIAGLKKKIPYRKLDFAIRGVIGLGPYHGNAGHDHAGHDHPGPLLGDI